MSCVPIPDFPPLPDIFPITLTPPPLPPLNLSIDYCCRLDLIDFTPYIPLGPLVLAVPGASEVIAVINETLDAVKAYLDALPLDCPVN